jgi:hypothetical protein
MKVTNEEIAAFRNMSPADKFRLICEMHMQARKWKRAAIQSLHPDWTSEQIDKRVKEIFLYGTS